jgi:hypothetical protein
MCSSKPDVSSSMLLENGSIGQQQQQWRAGSGFSLNNLSEWLIEFNFIIYNKSYNI